DVRSRLHHDRNRRRRALGRQRRRGTQAYEHIDLESNQLGGQLWEYCSPGYRTSSLRFRPSTQPAACNASRKTLTLGSKLASVLDARTPTRCTVPACCASTASGASARPSARTTASPIIRMGTSVEDGWRES